MARNRRTRLPSTGNLFSGDWSLVEAFIHRTQQGELGRIVAEQVRQLGFDIRFEVISAIMSHGDSIGQHFAPMDQNWRKNLTHRTLTGATLPDVGGDFPAPAIHDESVYFTGAYVNSIIEQYTAQKNGRKARVVIAPDPTAVVTTYYTRKDGSTRTTRVDAANLAGMLEYGVRLPNGKVTTPRPHWMPVFRLIPQMAAYKKLASMDAIRMELSRRMQVRLAAV